MSATIRNTGQSPISVSIDALEEIVRNCQRNEERLHDLEQHTRHERKKAELLLQETYRTMQDRDSQNTSIVDNVTTNENSHADDHRVKTQPSNEFFVALDDDDDDDDDDDENKNYRHRPSSSNNNRLLRQDKQLLERVEKLLAGDGTTTSSDVMSSQERQKKVIEKPTSPIEDDLDEKSLHIERKSRHKSRQLPSACSIENDLSAVDRLLSERTPINNHRIKSDIRSNHDNQVKKTVDYNDEKQQLSDKRDQQFYERLNNYVQTGRFVSPETDKQTTDEETYQSKSHPAPRINTKDDETYQSKSHPAPRINTKDDEAYQSKSRPVPRINTKDDELTDLARRCEDLLSRLHTQRNRAEMLENSTHHYEYYQRPTRAHSPTYESKPYSRHRSLSPSPATPPPPPISLQQSLELLRPEFISRSRQRARRIRLLREEREHNTEIDRERRQMLLFSCTTCCTNPSNRTVSSASSSRQNISYIVPYDRPDSSRIPLTYRQMKQATKKKYDQLPEVKDRRLQNQMDDIRRRNFLRAKVFRARLRQHVARHGRTNIDESLTMIDT